jgi:uncharacterized small protein (DUF1192 family)
MISNSKQNWTVGSTVKVGFLQLKIVAAIPTPNDSLPDVYFLTNLAGDKLYQFVPHQGLTAASLDEVEQKVAAYRAHVERVAAEATTRAAKAACIRTVFDSLFAEVA